MKNWMLYCSNQFISLFDKLLDYGNFSKIRKSSPESIFFNVFFWVLGKIKCTITYCSENIFPTVNQFGYFPTGNCMLNKPLSKCLKSMYFIYDCLWVFLIRWYFLTKVSLALDDKLGVLQVLTIWYRCIPPFRPYKLQPGTR